MANNHGSGASLPRPHRPRAQIMTTLPPITAQLAPLWPSSPVSLVQPRPECDRITNEYVETPFRAGQQSSQNGIAVSSLTPPSTPFLLLSTNGIQPTPQRFPLVPPPTITITKQPQPPPSGASNKEDLLLHNLHLHHDTLIFADHNGTAANASPGSPRSIVCPHCGRCRCHSCQQPKRLPHKWMCNNFCLCSADAVIDYTTCLCCVKAFMYHCCYEADNEEESCPDDPCSCAPDDMRTGRWTCLATMAFCLPCLWLYWPLQCGKRAVEACYVRHSRQGCRCRSTAQPATSENGHVNNAPPNLASGTISTTITPEKRLLDSSPEF